VPIGILRREAVSSVEYDLLHTFNAVKYASTLTNAEDISKEETELVLIAEWFHDTGLTVTYSGHEEKSVDIASSFLESQLADYKIKIVADCILATKRGVEPRNTLHYIMHDADYYHLFQPDYFQLVENLRLEVNEVQKKSFTIKEWHEENAKFLEQHAFYTNHCQSRWKEYKEILIMKNSRLMNESIH